MKAIVHTPSLDGLATQINAEHAAVSDSLSEGLFHAIEVGRLLAVAKQQVKHGEWLPWLGNHCPSVHERMARRYMQLYANRTALSGLGWRDAFKLLASGEKADEKQERREGRSAKKVVSGLGDFHLLHGELAVVGADVEAASVDWIITDPPYPKEFLPVYSDLGAFAARTLKPGGGLLCMVGQSYLPDVLERLTEHLRYHWTVAYLTPGGQAVQLWERHVMTFWKPVLWLVKGEYTGDWIGDVSRSDTNDNDKRFHEWGQSESGMADLLSRFSIPGNVVCDPFLGGGTTAVVSVALGRHFIGIDRDAEAIRITQERLAA